MTSPSTPLEELDQVHTSTSEADRPVEQDAVDQERVAFERNFDRTGTVAGWRELTIGGVTIILWFTLFTGGTLLSTQGYIAALAQTESFLDGVGLLSLILLFWTITNVGVLSILAAVLGALGQRTRFASATVVRNDVVSTDGNPRQVYNHYASAVMRGFGVYVLVLSGLLVLATDALTSPDQGQYVRLAGMISVISFYAGYDPDMLAGLLERIKSLIKSQ